MSKNIKKLIGVMGVIFISAVQMNMDNVANAASKTANVPIVSERLQEYKIIRNILKENYVVLQNTQTGEYYNTDPAMKNCEYWKDKKPGDVLKMKELLRKASYGQFNELEAINGDACVGVYPSRSQGDYRF